MRGLTVPIIWFDEFAFIPHVDELYTAATPAVSEASIKAKLVGAPTFKIIQTTPNNIDSLGGKYTKDMMNAAARFTEAMYDMQVQELSDFISREQTNNFVHIEFTYKQLGRDENWFINQCRDMNNDRLKIKREILLEFTKASETTVFSEEQIDTLDVFAEDNKDQIIVHGRPIHFIDNEIDYSHPYIIGVDVAGGLGKDYSAITIMDSETKVPVGYFYNNKIDTDDLGTLIYKLVSNWLPNSVVVIERNNYGLNIIQRLIKTSIHKNIYFEYVDDPSRQKEGDFREGNKVRLYGFQTTEGTREQMFELLTREVTYSPERFKIPVMIREIGTLEYNKRGKIEHSEGAHDDLLFQFMFCKHVLEFQSTLRRWIRVSNKKTIKTFTEISLANKAENQSMMMSNEFIQHERELELRNKAEAANKRKINRNILDTISKLNKK